MDSTSSKAACTRWLLLLRPEQWTKNLVVFAGLIFGMQLSDMAAVERAVVAFFCFCLLSSGTYLFNDILDLEADRQHPVKRLRPLPSGAVGPTAAAWVGAVLVAAGLAGMIVLPNSSLWEAGLAYVLLSYAYSLVLKHIVIIDAFAVAAEFVLRAVGGALAVNVLISNWLLLCTTFLALFLVLSKRRHELALLEGNAVVHRRSLGEYSIELLDQMIMIVTAATIVSYALYTLWPETVIKFGGDGLKYTIPFVLFGVFRYLFLVHRQDKGGQPERVLLTDAPTLTSVVLWIVTVYVILYLR